MKAISLWAPWAQMVALGAKRFETRSWGTDYRGWIAIHCAKYWDMETARLCSIRPFSKYYDAWQKTWEGRSTRGKVLAVVNLFSCFPTVETEGYMFSEAANCEEMRRDEIAMGDWSPGRFAWGMGRVQVLRRPVACRGFQRIWNLDGATEAAVLGEIADGQLPMADGMDGRKGGV